MLVKITIKIILKTPKTGLITYFNDILAISIRNVCGCEWVCVNFIGPIPFDIHTNIQIEIRERQTGRRNTSCVGKIGGHYECSPLKKRKENHRCMTQIYPCVFASFLRYGDSLALTLASSTPTRTIKQGCILLKMPNCIY